MRTIERQAAFRRDVKREKLSGRYKNFDKIIVDILTSCHRFAIARTVQ